MTDTLEMPGLPLADAMTAADLYAWEQAIAATISPQARVSIMANNSDGKCAYACVAPYGICNDSNRWYAWFETWPEAIRAAYAHAATLGPVQRNATIRRMALAIISLTDEHGTCTEFALIPHGFTVDQVAELHEAACELAGGMCSVAPFVVVRAGLDAGDAP